MDEIEQLRAELDAAINYGTLADEEIARWKATAQAHNDSLVERIRENDALWREGEIERDALRSEVERLTKALHEEREACAMIAETECSFESSAHAQQAIAAAIRARTKRGVR